MKRSKMKTRMLRDPKVKATLALPEFAHLHGDPFKLRELVISQLVEHRVSEIKQGPGACPIEFTPIRSVEFEFTVGADGTLFKGEGE